MSGAAGVGAEGWREEEERARARTTASMAPMPKSSCVPTVGGRLLVVVGRPPPAPPSCSSTRLGPRDGTVVRGVVGAGLGVCWRDDDDGGCVGAGVQSVWDLASADESGVDRERSVDVADDDTDACCGRCCCCEPASARSAASSRPSAAGGRGVVVVRPSTVGGSAASSVTVRSLSPLPGCEPAVPSPSPSP